MTSRPDRHATSTVRVALLGCGNVGSALAQLLLTRQDDIAARTGIRLELVAIAVSGANRTRPAAIPGELFGTDAAALVAKLSSTALELRRVLAGVDTGELNASLANVQVATDELIVLIHKLEERPSSVLFSKSPHPVRELAQPPRK